MTHVIEASGETFFSMKTKGKNPKEESEREWKKRYAVATSNYFLSIRFELSRKNTCPDRSAISKKILNLCIGNEWALIMIPS